MKLNFRVYSHFCEPEFFEINDIVANYNDFGDKYDIDSESAEEYCCSNMKFVIKEPTSNVIKKYGITETEYKMIAKLLESQLSFGSCGFCE